MALLVLLGSALAARRLGQPYRRGPNGEKIYQKLLSSSSSSSSSLKSLARVEKSIDSESSYPSSANSADGSAPTAQAALNYLNSVGGSDICYHASRAYLRAVLAGGNGEAATAAAEQAYKGALTAGFTSAPGSPCAVAELTFKETTSTGGDAVKEAARAYMDASPPTPCGLAGKTYVKAIAAGMAPRKAGLFAGKAFLDAAGDAQPDAVACTSASKGFVAQLAGDGESSILGAMGTFLDSGSGLDPVCSAAGRAFIDAKIEEASDEAAIKKAAVAYMAALQANPGAGGACLSPAVALIGQA